MRRILLILFLSSSLIASAQYGDNTFDFKIRTVQLYPSNLPPQSPAIIPIEQKDPLRLDFDYMGEEAPYFNYRIVHCNYDWTKSVLTDIEFMQDYNDFPIQDVEASGPTYITYAHYRFMLPRVKISGNYAVEVYWENNPKKVVLTRRFAVYENSFHIGARWGFSKVVSVIRKNQQIDFTVSYPDIDVQNPMQNVNVMIRQNFRWDNAVTGLKPNILREDIKRLEYNFFHGENDFPGLNEYRWFDVSDLINPRGFVDSVNNMGTHKEAYLRKDVSRGLMGYTFDPDRNGQYIIDNRRFGAPETDADYVWVNFTLDSPIKAAGDVYLFGAMSDWQTKDIFKMKYDTLNSVYRLRTLIKQGYYDYAYVVKNKKGIDETYYEGSHNATDNAYDILIYYRPFGKYNDRLVGYKFIE